MAECLSLPSDFPDLPTDAPGCCVLHVVARYATEYLCGTEAWSTLGGVLSDGTPAIEILPVDPSVGPPPPVDRDKWTSRGGDACLYTYIKVWPRSEIAEGKTDYEWASENLPDPPHPGPGDGFNSAACCDTCCVATWTALFNCTSLKWTVTPSPTFTAEPCSSILQPDRWVESLDCLEWRFQRVRKGGDCTTPWSPPAPYPEVPPPCDLPGCCDRVACIAQYTAVYNCATRQWNDFGGTIYQFQMLEGQPPLLPNEVNVWLNRGGGLWQWYDQKVGPCVGVWPDGSHSPAAPSKPPQTADGFTPCLPPYTVHEWVAIYDHCGTRAFTVTKMPVRQQLDCPAAANGELLQWIPFHPYGWKWTDCCRVADIGTPSDFMVENGLCPPPWTPTAPPDPNPQPPPGFIPTPPRLRYFRWDCYYDCYSNTFMVWFMGSELSTDTVVDPGRLPLRQWNKVTALEPEMGEEGTAVLLRWFDALDEDQIKAGQLPVNPDTTQQILAAMTGVERCAFKWRETVWTVVYDCGKAKFSKTSSGENRLLRELPAEDALATMNNRWRRLDGSSNDHQVFQWSSFTNLRASSPQIPFQPNADPNASNGLDACAPKVCVHTWYTVLSCVGDCSCNELGQPESGNTNQWADPIYMGERSVDVAEATVLFRDNRAWMPANSENTLYLWNDVAIKDVECESGVVQFSNCDETVAPYPIGPSLMPPLPGNVSSGASVRVNLPAQGQQPCGKPGDPGPACPRVEWISEDDRRVITRAVGPVTHQASHNGSGLTAEDIGNALGIDGLDVHGFDVLHKYTGFVISQCFWAMPGINVFTNTAACMNHVNSEPIFGFGKGQLLYGGAHPHTPHPGTEIWNDKFCNIAAFTMAGVTEDNSDKGTVYGVLAKDGGTDNSGKYLSGPNRGKLGFRLSLYRLPDRTEQVAVIAGVEGEEHRSGVFTVIFTGPYQGTSRPGFASWPQMVLKHIFRIDSEREINGCLVPPHGVYTALFQPGIHESAEGGLIVPKLRVDYGADLFPTTDLSVLNLPENPFAT